MDEIALGLKRRDGHNGVTLEVSFTVPLDERESHADRQVLGVAHPYLSAHRFVRTVLDAVRDSRSIGRVVIADLRVLRSLSNADELRRAIGVLCLLMRRMGTPLVLIESSANRISLTDTKIGVRIAQAPGQDVASCVDFADLSIEVLVTTDANNAMAVVTELRTGQSALVKPSTTIP